MSKLSVKRFTQPDEVRPFVDKGTARMVDLEGKMVAFGTFEPGWRWSQHIKPLANTESCEASHQVYVLSGRMLIRMNDGQQAELSEGDVAVIPPGHDAWVLGAAPCRLIDFGELRNYATQQPGIAQQSQATRAEARPH